MRKLMGLVLQISAFVSFNSFADNIVQGGNGTANTGTRPSLDEEDAPKVVDALKKHSKCGSLVVVAKNVTAVLWIENGKMLSGRYLWNQNARNTLSSGTTGNDLNVSKLDETLPEPNLYKADPFGTSKKLEDILDKEVAKANQAGKFQQCDQPLTS